MAGTEYETTLDKVEIANLQKAISQVETANAASAPGARPFFDTFLLNAKSRVATLEKKIKDSQTEREIQSHEQTAVVSLVQQETRLNAREQQTYGNFLKKEFFTKKDFGALEQFYEKSWDRLSDDGKAQMSHRIWEGVRRDEFKFSELPKPVREKEAKQVYNLLRDSAGKSGDVSRIPERDREDFVRAYEAGKHDEAAKALDRDGFKQNLFRGKESAARAHTGVDRGNAGDRTAALANLEAPKQNDSAKSPVKSPTGTDRDLSAALEGVKLTDVQAQGTSAEIPNGKSGSVPQSARGC